MLLKPLHWAEVESDQWRGRVRRRASGQGLLPHPLTGPRGRLFAPGPGTSLVAVADGSGSMWQRLHNVKTGTCLVIVLSGPCTWLGAGLASGHLEKIQQPTEISQGPKLEKVNNKVDNVVLDYKPKQKANIHEPTLIYVNDGINKYVGEGDKSLCGRMPNNLHRHSPPRRGGGPLSSGAAVHCDRLPKGSVWRGKRGPAGRRTLANTTTSARGSRSTSQVKVTGQRDRSCRQHVPLTWWVGRAGHLCGLPPKSRNPATHET